MQEPAAKRLKLTETTAYQQHNQQQQQQHEGLEDQLLLISQSIQSEETILEELFGLMLAYLRSIRGHRTVCWSEIRKCTLAYAFLVFRFQHCFPNPTQPKPNYLLLTFTESFSRSLVHSIVPMSVQRTLLKQYGGFASPLGAFFLLELMGCGSKQSHHMHHIVTVGDLSPVILHRLEQTVSLGKFWASAPLLCRAHLLEQLEQDITNRLSGGSLASARELRAWFPTATAAHWREICDSHYTKWRFFEHEAKGFYVSRSDT